MSLLKVITIFNWVVIAVLGLLVAAETIFPTKGGDAAGRGIGLAFYYLAIIAFIVLLTLNLLPYKWAKYTALGLVAVPFLLIQIWPIWKGMQQRASYLQEESKPIFEDPERDQMARAIRDGEVDQLKKLLQTPAQALHQDGELLAYAVSEANHSAYKPQEKLECVKLLFEAGASLDSIRERDVPIHMAVADVGNASLLRLLLEHGADANAYQINFKRPILFEAIGSYKEPEASVRVLLDFGADPNATAVLDDETGPVSPIWRAAELERWGVCLILLEKGAKPDFKSATGTSLRTLVLESNRAFPSEGYSTQADYERLVNMLK